jgi:hypothetical protein
MRQQTTMTLLSFTVQSSTNFRANGENVTHSSLTLIGIYAMPMSMRSSFKAESDGAWHKQHYHQ